MQNFDPFGADDIREKRYASEVSSRSIMRANPLPLDRGSVADRVALDGEIVHITDVPTDSEYKMSELARIGGLRTVLGVPLLREGKPTGVLVLQRNTVQPFGQNK